MDTAKYPTDKEFLELLKLASEELSPELTPVTKKWVSGLHLETSSYLEIGESLTTKRLALSLIKVLAKMELEYRRHD